MGMIILPIIMIIIMLVFFVIFLLIFKRQETTLKTVDNKGNVKVDNKIEADSEKKKSNKDTMNEIKKEDVFNFMEFDRILDDMIVQNGGSRFTMAIQCKGINYDLMSEIEQLSVEEGFITFLNTLKYPIQLYVQAQNIDLKGAISKYKEQLTPLEEKYNEVDKQYSKVVSAFDAEEEEVDKITKERDSVANVYEYANDIIKYVEKMSTNKNLLQRKFFVLVSYTTSELPAIEKFSKDEVVEMCSTELITRCRSVISALSSCSVSGKILTSNELADLLYSSYNRDDKGILSVKEAIESGYFRLYSTSEDAFEKKADALDEYLRNEAKIRALEAMKYIIENNEIDTPASNELAQEEDISRRATNMIKNEDMEPETKDKINKKILSDYRETKKILSEEDAIQREDFKDRIEQDVKEIEGLKNIEKPKGIELLEKAEKLKKEVKNDEVNEIVVTEELKTDNENVLEESIYSIENKSEENSDENDSII